MRVKIKAGTFQISEAPKNPSHPIFEAVESYWEEWFKELPEDDQDKWFGPNAIYNKSQAIKEAVDQLISFMKSKQISLMTSRRFYEVDFEAVWE